MQDDDHSGLTDQEKWQAAHDTMQALLDSTNEAFDAARTQEQRDALDEIADEASNALTLLNRQDLQSNTVVLQATEEPMQASIGQLNTLKEKLAAVSAGLATAAQVIGGIDEAVGDASAFFGL